MKKLILTILVIISTVQVYAADTSRIEVRGSVIDGTTNKQDTGYINNTFTTGIKQQNTLSLPANTFTSLATTSIPAGTKAVMIDVGTNRSLVLKSITGDSGISLDSSCPVVLPVSADNVTIGILNKNGSAVSVGVYYF